MLEDGWNTSPRARVLSESIEDGVGKSKLKRKRRWGKGVSKGGQGGGKAKRGHGSARVFVQRTIS